MARRTKYQVQHSDLPPSSSDPIQEQGDQPNLNDHHAEEASKHRHGKDPMIVEANDGTNLLTRCTERLEDVISAVQTTVNQLN